MKREFVTSLLTPIHEFGAMDGRLLTGVTVLDAVIESGGFSRAAEALGMSASGVSRAIARLERASAFACSTAPPARFR